MIQNRKSPADFFKQALGREVVIKMNDESEFIGQLVCIDGILNIALEKVQQFQNGMFVRKYPKVFLRGNNVFYITPKPIKNLKKIDEKSKTTDTKL